MKPWIGVDLDGTLAYYGDWEGMDKIGKPVPKMVNRVKEWLAQGKTVKIMTARAEDPDAQKHIRPWLEKAGLPRDLEITNRKDFGMVELWDDRCIQVIPNTGRRADGGETGERNASGPE